MSHHLMYSIEYAYYTQRMFSLRPMNTPDQAKRTDTGKRRSKPPEPICECENSVALNHLAILGGLGLLAHCAEFGECLSEGSPAKRVGNPPVRAGSTPSHRSPHTLHPPLNMSAYGASERQELSQHRITLDARPFSERIGA